MPKLADRVLETTTTTGTGAYSLAGAVSGFRAFSAAFVTTDTVYYCVENGTDWEVGIGTLTSGSPWTLARTSIIASSNAGSAVNWGVGTKNVFATVSAAAPGLTGREVLTADRTYYVRTDGSDSNNGLADTSGGAFLTIQKAVNTVTALDMAGFNTIISVGAGTFNYTDIALKNLLGGECTIRGQGPASTTLYGSTRGFSLSSIVGQWILEDFKLTSAGWGINNSGSKLKFKNIEFGSCSTLHIHTTALGVTEVTGNYSVSAGCPYHTYVARGSVFLTAGRTVTITNGPTFSSAWAWVEETGVYRGESFTVSGTAYGPRYYVKTNGVLFANGAAESLPGSTSGSTASGGQVA